MDILNKLRERADEIPQEIADRENACSGCCGSYGDSTYLDYLDNYDRCLMIDAADLIEKLHQELIKMKGES